MKTNHFKGFKNGFVSYLLVLSSGIVMTLLMVAAYKRAIASQQVQGQVQLRSDYSDKEESILRGIVANAPNAAIDFMQNGASGTNNWASVFRAALASSNTDNSINTDLQIQNTVAVGLGMTVAQMNGSRKANAGDVPGGLTIANVFGSPLVRSGTTSINSSYPPALDVGIAGVTQGVATSTQDALYPIIAPPAKVSSHQKVYGAAAHGYTNATNGKSKQLQPALVYPRFNQLTYPNIGFGLAAPGEAFIAKRNWWAFSINAAAQNASQTRVGQRVRNFVLSIYEVPTQTPISGVGGLQIGRYDNNIDWANSAGAFAMKGNIISRGATAVGALTGKSTIGKVATRNSLDLTAATGAIDGTQVSLIGGNSGQREKFELNKATDVFYPVSRASESGRSAFIPISVGAGYYDRNLAGGDTPNDWQHYTSAAQQCAMRLDFSAVGGTPVLQFSYLKADGLRSNTITFTMPATGPAPGLANGLFPFEMKQLALPSGVSTAVVVHMEYLPLFLSGISDVVANKPLSVLVSPGGFKAVAAGTTDTHLAPSSGGYRGGQLLNNSLVINVAPGIPGVAPSVVLGNCQLLADPSGIDSSPGAGSRTAPQVPPGVAGPGFSGFGRGFSLVTNLSLFIPGGRINTQPMTPADRTALGDGTDDLPEKVKDGTDTLVFTTPPFSLISPSKFVGLPGLGFTPKYTHTGQASSTSTSANPLNTTAAEATTNNSNNRNISGTINADINLSQISHPGLLPPITLMNWLVVLDEIGR
jgi:hypothetical protein